MANEYKMKSGRLRWEPQKDEFKESFEYLIYLFLIWQCRTACGTLVPQPGMESEGPALEAWSLNHWTTRDVPTSPFFFKGNFLYSIDKMS